MAEPETFTYWKVSPYGDLINYEYSEPPFAHAYRTHADAIAAARRWLEEQGAERWAFSSDVRRVVVGSARIEEGDGEVVLRWEEEVRTKTMCRETSEVVVDGETYTRTKETPAYGEWEPARQKWKDRWGVPRDVAKDCHFRLCVVRTAMTWGPSAEEVDHG